jgi:hypothetical protein
MNNHREFVFDLKPLFNIGGGIIIEYEKLKVNLPVNYDGEIYNFISHKLSTEDNPLTPLQIEAITDDLALDITKYKIFNILFQNKPEVI